MDLSLLLKKAKLGECETGRTRGDCEKKATMQKDGGRSSRKSSDSPTRPTRRSENRPKGVPRDLFTATIAIGSGRGTRFDDVAGFRGNRSKGARKKDTSGTAVSSTNDSYMSILN